MTQLGRGITIKEVSDAERVHLARYTKDMLGRKFNLGSRKAEEIQGGYNDNHNSELRLAVLIAIDECLTENIKPLQTKLVRAFLSMINEALPDNLKDVEDYNSRLVERIGVVVSNSVKAAMREVER